jgi:hypothetical protein
MGKKPISRAPNYSNGIALLYLLQQWAFIPLGLMFSEDFPLGMIADDLDVDEAS